MNLQSRQGLSPEKLQLFVASLSGLADDEIRKAKILFIRNELSELRAFKTSFSGFTVLQGCFALIPFFWPILWAQRRSMEAMMSLQKDQVLNALSVWRDDLGDEAGRIQAELESL
ncbi:MAG: hypothetical protein AAGM22_08710 [Acidobacteriota bacterium]